MEPLETVALIVWRREVAVLDKFKGGGGHGQYPKIFYCIIVIL